MIKKIKLLLFIFITSYYSYAQEYVEILRASDNNILVNPARGIDGRNSLTLLDTRSLRGSRFNLHSYASASFRMTDNMIYCPALLFTNRVKKFPN